MMAANKKGCRSTMNRTLPMLSVFADWACVQEQYLRTPDAPVLSSAREVIAGEEGPGADVAAAPPALFADSASAAGAPLVLSAQDWDRAFLAPAELLRAEIRARSGVRASISALRDVLAADLQKNEYSRTGSAGPGAQVHGSGEEAAVQFLREHIELRGFLPVALTVEVSTQAILDYHCCSPLSYFHVLHVFAIEIV